METSSQPIVNDSDWTRINGTALGKIWGEVTLERVKQEVKFGDSGMTCANPSMSPLLALAVLMEEVGEVAHVLNEGEGIDQWRHYCREELIQVAAVAVAWIEGLDKQDAMELVAKAQEENPRQ
jgi:NTP pyrophosphatase (non-canonical NTP hydrolase)